MSEPLVRVSRGPVVESIHRGDAVVVNTSGEILYFIGDPYKYTYIRSAAKPLQTINVFLSGAQNKFEFTDEELSIMCASHYGEDFHKKVIENMLEKIGLKMEDLNCGKTLSIKPEYAQIQLKENHIINQANNDCSGKHCGILASCIAKGYDLGGYTEDKHPVEQDILKVISMMCEIEPEDIKLGVDGCSVPVHAMPIYNMALGYAKLANPNSLEKNVKEGCEKIFTAMNNAPEMVAGTGGFCTELIKNTNGKLIGKLGAEGVFCIGVKEKGIGLAVKIEDGNYYRAINPAVMRCLEDLEILDNEELEKLSRFISQKNINNLGTEVGQIEPCFHLKKEY
nr:asparaginase [Acetoanaerobium pronyense]